jgi:glycosyltransferase involved in cell wall biosynthesis
MDLTIAVEHRFLGTPDGAVWTQTALARASWNRYLAAFGRVRILARVLAVPLADARWLRVDGDRVEVAWVPYFVGPGAYLGRWREVERMVREALAARPDDAVILRAPGTIATVAGRALAAAGRPFALEVVSDPQDVFAPGSVDHPLRAAFRWAATRDLRRLCATCASALYVTRAALQRRYAPAPRASGGFAVSDAELAEEAFATEPRGPDAPAGPPFRLVTVGTLEQLYKSPEVVIQAVARLAAEGLDTALTVVGDGRYRGRLVELAARLGVAERVRLTGQLPSGAAVRAELDRAHAFVLPSRADAMPRALLEAMARGLPCLGTRVGGIPELLPEDALVALDAGAIAARVRALAESPHLRAAMSRRNLSRARQFHDRVLQPLRQEFYRHVVAETERWAARADGTRLAPGGHAAHA